MKTSPKETVAFQAAYILFREEVDPTDIPWIETFKAGWEGRTRYDNNMRHLEKLRRRSKKTTATKKKSGQTRKRKPLSADHRRKISEGRKRRFAVERVAREMPIEAMQEV